MLDCRLGRSESWVGVPIVPVRIISVGDPIAGTGTAALACSVPFRESAVGLRGRGLLSEGEGRYGFARFDPFGLRDFLTDDSLEGVTVPRGGSDGESKELMSIVKYNVL